jgi:hypothetical protein
LAVSRLGAALFEQGVADRGRRDYAVAAEHVAAARAALLSCLAEQP